MGVNWTKLQTIVYKVFEKQGFGITVRVDGSPGTWNPTTMVYDSATDDTDYTTYAIKDQYDISRVDGTIVQQNDIRLFFPAYGANAAGTLGALPTLGAANKILIGGVEQNVVNLKPVDPGNTVIMYEGQIR